MRLFDKIFILVLIFQLSRAGKYLINTNKLNYEAAVSYCKGKEMELVRIPDANTNTIVNSLATKFSMGTYWINGNDITKEGTWVDTRGKDLPYKNWSAGEPNNFRGGENCLHGAFYPNGLWNDIACSSVNSVICEASRIDIHFTSTKMNYITAVKYCSDKKMEMVRIDNAETNYFIHSLAVKNNLGFYWINGNDIAKEGTWADTDCKALTYKNWSPGEPNNFGAGEHCIQGYRFSNELWNDANCADQYSVICTSIDPCDF